MYTALNAIAGLRTALAPYLPLTCARLNEYLGETASIEELGWQVHALEPGTPLATPSPLFKKLDSSMVAEEEARLRG